MKAIRLHVLEGPDELVYEDVPGGVEPQGSVRYTGPVSRGYA